MSRSQTTNLKTQRLASQLQKSWAQLQISEEAQFNVFEELSRLEGVPPDVQKKLDFLGVAFTRTTDASVLFEECVQATVNHLHGLTVARHGKAPN